MSSRKRGTAPVFQTPAEPCRHGSDVRTPPERSLWAASGARNLRSLCFSFMADVLASGRRSATKTPIYVNYHGRCANRPETGMTQSN